MSQITKLQCDMCKTKADMKQLPFRTTDNNPIIKRPDGWEELTFKGFKFDLCPNCSRKLSNDLNHRFYNKEEKEDGISEEV